MKVIIQMIIRILDRTCTQTIWLEFLAERVGKACSEPRHSPTVYLQSEKDEKKLSVRFHLSRVI